MIRWNYFLEARNPTRSSTTNVTGIFINVLRKVRIIIKSLNSKEKETEEKLFKKYLAHKICC